MGFDKMDGQACMLMHGASAGLRLLFGAAACLGPVWDAAALLP
jgi:hypothetical protein